MIIRDIDSCHLDHWKKLKLRKRMMNDQPFLEFIDELLKELGYMNEFG